MSMTPDDRSVRAATGQNLRFWALCVITGCSNLDEACGWGGVKTSFHQHPSHEMNRIGYRVHLRTCQLHPAVANIGVKGLNIDDS